MWYSDVSEAGRNQSPQPHRETAMLLENFIITVLLGRKTDDFLFRDHRLRQRGFVPKLTNNEAITLE